jgi:hypothetical protein
MLRANQRRQAIKNRSPWPDASIVDPRLVTRPKRARGLKPGLAEAVGAMHDMITLERISVNAASIVVARQMRNWWLAAWTRNAATTSINSPAKPWRINSARPTIGRIARFHTYRHSFN